MTENQRSQVFRKVSELEGDGDKAMLFGLCCLLFCPQVRPLQEWNFMDHVGIRWGETLRMQTAERGEVWEFDAFSNHRGLFDSYHVVLY